MRAKSIAITRAASVTPFHMFLAALTSVTWGLSFVVGRIAIDSFSAPQLVAVRFLITTMFLLFVARPRAGWLMLLMIGMTLFTGQFLLVFFAYEAGLPPGLASITQQMQVFFTVLLSAIFLGDVPTRRQLAGMSLAFSGLALIGFSVGGDLRPAALTLALGSAFSWAVGNVLLKRLPDQPFLPLIVWASLVPPVPALMISAAQGRGDSIIAAIAGASWTGIAAVVYLGSASTMVYAIWGNLLKRYPAGVVAPFALLSPGTGVAASAIVFGEAFGPIRYAGMGLILAGLVVIVLPGRRLAK
jgi:O-acetylserine/cysteine efflux transporter